MLEKIEKFFFGCKSISQCNKLFIPKGTIIKKEIKELIISLEISGDLIDDPSFSIVIICENEEELNEINNILDKLPRLN